jgi:hypothetical protein
VDDIITSCARLPLALAVAPPPARALMPTFPLAELATQLRDAAEPAQPLVRGGPRDNSIGLLVVLPDARRPGGAAVPAHGPVPGPDITVPAAPA